MSSNVAHSNEMLEHPRVGRIVGIKASEQVVQYLGVQYATLKNRFSRGKLANYGLKEHFSSRSQGAVDATKHGPIVMNPVNGCSNEHALIQKALPFTSFRQSDTECLTLNISVPKGTGREDGLPVMAFIHGGGFAGGSSSYPHYDLALITALSVKVGMPMISVGVNYRVGIPGFIYSLDVNMDGSKPNNGLHDQRLALLWIKDNIGGFGGDPERVTFVGESAGASSGCYQLHSDEPLFQQYVSMSGSSLLRPRRPELIEKSFKFLASELSAGNASPELQLQTLSEANGEDLMAKFARRYAVGPVVDGDIIPSITAFETLADPDEALKHFPGIRHCRRILVGDCQMDGMIWLSRLVGRTDIFPRTLGQYLTGILDPIETGIAKEIISAYQLDITATSNTQATTKTVLNFGNDVAFAVPAIVLAQTWSTSPVSQAKAFLYHFNCPNPWDGPWKGESTHALDIAFALQNYREYLSAGQHACAERIARDIVKFVNGADPWEEYNEHATPGSMVYFAPAKGEKDESRFARSEDPEQTGRRIILQKLTRKGLLDKVTDAWQLFLQGPTL